MDVDHSLSIIIPAYNAEKTIEECINRICEEGKKFNSEIIVIDDNSKDKTFEIAKKFESIKLVKLKKNRGVGYVRNLGARISKHNNLCYIDSDLIISEDSILYLINKLYQNKNIGSVGAIQKIENLNAKSWSSNFVCVKSCYGFDEVENETEFSEIKSEFCVITKKFLKQVGGWKSFRNAGGEEYELGYRINQFGKKIIVIKDASYKTYYVSLFLRFIRIVDRTEKYLHVFIEKKRFDSLGAFATINQAFSSLLTLIISILALSSLYFDKWFVLIGLVALIITQIIVEYKFLLFSKKHFGLKMLFFSLIGIQIINMGILFGVAYFILNITNLPFKKIKSFF